MASGGFDVIIGNPPYLEYSRVKDYAVRNYETARCSNLYVYTVERSLGLLRSDGRMGMIIPISVACSGAMDPLRSLYKRSGRHFWGSHYANRPGQLFSGAQNRLTIALSGEVADEPETYSTRYHRWDARNGERDNLFPTLQYQTVGPELSLHGSVIPKVGSVEGRVVLTKLRTSKTVAAFTSRMGTHKVYWVRVPGYFCLFMLTPPMARPEKGGEPRVRGEVFDVRFDTEQRRDVVHAILNSNIFYYFFCVYTDTRHINRSDVADFPLDLDSIPEATQSKLRAASAALDDCFRANMVQRRKSGLLIDSIDAKPCKPEIDAIDRILAAHYGLTQRELDFVINYDIKYRVGVESAG